MLCKWTPTSVFHVALINLIFSTNIDWLKLPKESAIQKISINENTGNVRYTFETVGRFNTESAPFQFFIVNHSDLDIYGMPDSFFEFELSNNQRDIQPLYKQNILVLQIKKNIYI